MKNHQTIYQKLARSLDSLPNGFPATEDGTELNLLAKLYTPEEAALAAELSDALETPPQIADRMQAEGKLDMDSDQIRNRLKGMARKGLIAVGRTQAGLGYKLMPFVVGVYEAQAGRIDEELAHLFEIYYRQAFGLALNVKPAFHRVIPVGESIKVDMEIKPYEDISQIIDNANAWGVLDCICRTQKTLIGDPCEHPVDVCMIFSKKPGSFDHNEVIRALTHEEAKETIRRAAKAGLVHTVSNTKEGVHYVCNCCTCSCGILRGIADLGIANVVARSGFVNQVDSALCTGCETCIEFCQFGALEMGALVVQVVSARCTGCGVCITNCPEKALELIRRPENEILPIPINHTEWGAQRMVERFTDPN
jgi:Na+-translocating ferredoxin:NAD+ oxidoreductase RNF subunit RnfB